MRDFMGYHVSQVDGHGNAVNVDEVHVSTSVCGSFRARYAAHINKVCVQVECQPGLAYMTMQLSLDQAILLRELVDGAIADALEATTVEVPLALPVGGDLA